MDRASRKAQRFCDDLELPVKYSIKSNTNSVETQVFRMKLRRNSGPFPISFFTISSRSRVLPFQGEFCFMPESSSSPFDFMVHSYLSCWGQETAICGHFDVSLRCLFNKIDAWTLIDFHLEFDVFLEG